MSSQLFPGIAVLSVVILLLVVFLRHLKQPYFIAYIGAGVLLGRSALNIIHEPQVIAELGELGILLLMFSIGMEVDFQRFKSRFGKPIFIVLFQLALSLSFIYFVGRYLEWDINAIVLTSFITSLSSSAIVFQYLSQTGELKSKLGSITSGVLLAQDVLVIPMILTLNFSTGHTSSTEVIKVCLGCLLIVLLLRAPAIKKVFSIPVRREIIADHDLQVFIGCCVCFGMAGLTSWFGLSPALGAFCSGILIGRDRSTHWLGKVLKPFRTFFMAFFFLAIGLQLDLIFFAKNAATILAVTLCVLFCNSIINALLFRLSGNKWRDSWYAGALLAQIGEFSFVLLAMGQSLGIIGDYTVQITLAVATLTMLLTTVWLAIIQRAIYRLPRVV